MALLVATGLSLAAGAVAINGGKLQGQLYLVFGAMLPVAAAIAARYRHDALGLVLHGALGLVSGVAVGVGTVVFAPPGSTQFIGAGAVGVIVIGIAFEAAFSGMLGAMVFGLKALVRRIRGGS